MANDMLKQIWPEWEIEGKPLGKGAFGMVYKAVRSDHNVRSYAAIKEISIPSDEYEIDSLRADGLDMDATKTFLHSIVDDFINEIQLMESLKGTQNIVSVEDYKVVKNPDEIGWTIFIRMELLTPFNKYILDKKLSEQDVIKLGCDICSALEICGQRNIIHRDIKPENIFVNDFGFYKLGDFGIARRLENLTGGLSQKGTFNYMAPEVAKSTNYDSRVDIYSLGVVLYRLLNGNRLPFLYNEQQLMNPNERKKAIDRRLRGEPLPAPCDASPAMTQVILRACAYEPNDRFATATEMKQALMNVANAAPQAAASAIPVQPTAAANYPEGTVLLSKAPDTSNYGQPETPVVSEYSAPSDVAYPAQPPINSGNYADGYSNGYSQGTVLLSQTPAYNQPEEPVVSELGSSSNYTYPTGPLINTPAYSDKTVMLSQEPNYNQQGMYGNNHGAPAQPPLNNAGYSDKTVMLSQTPDYNQQGMYGSNYGAPAQPPMNNAGYSDKTVMLSQTPDYNPQSIYPQQAEPVVNSFGPEKANKRKKIITIASIAGGVAVLAVLAIVLLPKLFNSPKPDTAVSSSSSTASVSSKPAVSSSKSSIASSKPSSSTASTAPVSTATSSEPEEVLPPFGSMGTAVIQGEEYDVATTTSLALGVSNVTNEDLVEVAKLVNLKKLMLGKNNISDISPLTALTNLTELDLHSNQISDISMITKLPNLTNLNLRDNSITDITIIANMTNLTELDLRRNPIADIKPIANLKKLEVLSLADTRDADGDYTNGVHLSDLTPLSGLTGLKELYLDGGSINNLKPLETLTNLTALSLENNFISDISSLAKLKNLTYLRLSEFVNGNKVTDIKPLAGLTKLTNLYLDGNPIGDLSVLANFKNLMELDLAACQLTSIVPLANLTELKSLYLNGNKIVDITPLAKLTKLTTLEMGANEIADISPLANLRSLTELSLSYNLIRDVSPLSGLVKLTSLDLEGNYFSDLKPLANLKELSYLNIMFIELNGADVAWLHEQLPNWTINYKE